MNAAAHAGESRASGRAGKDDCDVLVVGSGASGLTAAIAAHHQGLSVDVVEKQPHIGGCSAYSHGMLWMPGNPVAARAGLVDSRQAATTYLRGEMGDKFEAAREELELYLEHGPRMVAFLENKCGLRFELRKNFPDFRSELPGAAQCGRTIQPASYDAWPLRRALRRLLPPRTALLGMSFTPAEGQLIGSRSASGMLFLVRRMMRHIFDLTVLGRSTQLAGGSALVAALLKAALDRSIPIHTETRLHRLICDGQRVVGAELECANGRRRQVIARRGVVLAAGGWGHALTQGITAVLDGGDVPTKQASWSLAPPGCTGDGLRAALALGATLETPASNGGFWTPASRLPGPDGRLSTHAHDRFKPGFLAITPDGQRFANEADSNHHFCEALLRATPAGQTPVGWLVCDRRALMQTGLGDVIHGAPFPIGPHLRSGYLLERDRLDALALAMGVDPAVFLATVERFNAGARRGHDPDFGKGSTRFNRAMGRPGGSSNPCLRPMEHGPFYAVQFSVAHMATLAGLRTDSQARVLDERNEPIPGLYAAGNDRVNLFRGGCPGGGITLGPGMTWAYLAAHSLADTSATVPAPLLEPPFPIV